MPPDAQPLAGPAPRPPPTPLPIEKSWLRHWAQLIIHVVPTLLLFTTTRREQLHHSDICNQNILSKISLFLFFTLKNLSQGYNIQTIFFTFTYLA